MSRYAISKSTVSVSFPLTGLDLGPFGPVDCGENKNEYNVLTLYMIKFEYCYV